MTPAQKGLVELFEKKAKEVEELLDEKGGVGLFDTSDLRGLITEEELKNAVSHR